MPSDSTVAFDYIVALDSDALTRDDFVHPHMVHRANCSYFTQPLNVSHVIPLTEASVVEMHRRKIVEADPATHATWGYHFCMRCMIHPDGSMR